MPDLILTRNLSDPDGFYADLMAVHDGLTKAESDALTARLVLILANHIGSRDVLSAALQTAKGTAQESPQNA
ncbi:MAG: Protein of unknown function (DUF2783) [Roseibaca calidilacus]|uniref:DUF2783 domain-containing protein n=1 Tax=Roseibaca calidilacus TaxID=1666912 RepID=A0A0N8K783_9RHOB|nr:DUF2783 domain-containing protein [Roseibaca calidilacus]KPP91017.1 MAG: Protein of unknown function (DUF2783) [Roseibaca calidilacus]CUX83982.1 Protein of unknown function (DUF2783) [Roseibaca calidilacus]